MPDILRFVSPLMGRTGGQAVYMKSTWSGGWTLYPEAWASETVWTVAPSIPTAQLRFRYGDELHRDILTWRKVARPGDRLRWLARLDHTVSLINSDDDSSTVRRWYGIIDIELDDFDGLFFESGKPDAHPRGKVHLTAYGLEALLDEAEIRTSILKTSQGTETVKRALTFNPRGPTDEGSQPAIIGNRSTTDDGDGVYLFHDGRTGGVPWSTRDILRYLLKYHTPRGSTGAAALEFELYDAHDIVPTWDSPEVIPEGRTVGELLRSLLARQRLMSYRTVVEETDSQGAITNGKVRIVPISFAGEDLTFDSFETQEQPVFRANPDQVILALEEDRGARAGIKRSTADALDQVIVRGARRTSTATFSFTDGTLAIGWPAALETQYEQGASTDGSYPAAGEMDKRLIANINARAAEKFRPVYQRFILPEPWNGIVGDGTSGTPDEVLMAEDGSSDAVPLAPQDQRFLTELPLLAGYDYSGDKIGQKNPTEITSKPHKRLEPIVLFPRPGGNPPASGYRHAEKVGIISELGEGWSEGDFWQASSRVDPVDGALWLDVHSGLGQHVIAAQDFTTLPDDLVIPGGNADFRKMVCTLAVAWSAYAEGVYPATAPEDRDVIRQRVFDAGDIYRLDYVVPETIVGITPATGALLRSDGGYLRDDRPYLKALAKIAWQWYGKTRRALSFTTSLTNNALELGMYIVSIGDPDLSGDVHIDEVESVVTSIRLTSPLAEGTGPVVAPTPTMHYDTAFGELDVLKLRISGL